MPGSSASATAVARPAEAATARRVREMCNGMGSPWGWRNSRYVAEKERMEERKPKSTRRSGTTAR
ncbi:hypothetical protein GCM10010331_14830 [Streptomyces xanthochromogenes]|nr:hypothetical protein GCM10010331_14830 [Streptomyces xanthochromogenes]